MAKHTFKIGSSAADAEPGGGGFYDGPKPPPGVYNAEVKFIRIKVNKNGDDMLNVLTEIAEPKGPKAKFNGYGVWNNLNVTDDSAGFVNALLDAMGINRKSFWPPNGPVVDNNDPPNITKIGTKRPEGCKLRIATADEEYNGVARLKVVRYLGLKDTDPDEEPDEDETDETEEVEEEADDTEAEAEEEEAEGDAEALTEEELAEYSADELKEICDSWEIPYTAKATAKSLIKKILDAQEAAASPEAEEEPEEEEVEEEEEAEEEVGYAEDDLKAMSLDELKAIVTDEFELALPKPPIKPRLIKAILTAQAAPPF